MTCDDILDHLINRRLTGYDQIKCWILSGACRIIIHSQEQQITEILLL